MAIISDQVYHTIDRFILLQKSVVHSGYVFIYVRRCHKRRVPTILFCYVADKIRKSNDPLRRNFWRWFPWRNNENNLSNLGRILILRADCGTATNFISHFSGSCIIRNIVCHGDVGKMSARGRQRYFQFPVFEYRVHGAQRNVRRVVSHSRYSMLHFRRIRRNVCRNVSCYAQLFLEPATE